MKSPDASIHKGVCKAIENQKISAALRQLAAVAGRRVRVWGGRRLSQLSRLSRLSWRSRLSRLS